MNILIEMSRYSFNKKPTYIVANECILKTSTVFIRTEVDHINA